MSPVGNFAGPLLVVGGRRRGARRDALAAGLAAGNEAVGLVVAAGAPDAPVHEDGATRSFNQSGMMQSLGPSGDGVDEPGATHGQHVLPRQNG